MPYKRARKPAVDLDLKRLTPIADALERGRVKDALVVPFELVSRIFTRERLRLLRLVREKGPFRSIRALAAALGRDYPRVHKDVNTLVVHGLVKVERPRGERRTRATVSAPAVPVYLF